MARLPHPLGNAIRPAAPESRQRGIASVLHLNASRHLSIHEAVELVATVAEALHHAHKQACV
jgi:hypothetical protein